MFRTLVSGVCGTEIKKNKITENPIPKLYAARHFQEHDDGANDGQKVDERGVVDDGPVRRPSKSVVFLVFAELAEGVLVALQAQRAEHKAAHLLSAWGRVPSHNVLGQGENLDGLGLCGNVFG